MITRILIGLLISGIGVMMLYKTEWILSTVGTVEWAEKNLGGGGSRLFWKLFGLVMCIIGFAVMTNLWTEFAQGSISFLFGK